MEEKTYTEFAAGTVKDLFSFVAMVGKEVMQDPKIHAHLRLGGKEAGNIFDLSRDGSISQGSHEYGMPFTLTPGEIANQKDAGNVWGGGNQEDIMKAAQEAGRQDEGHEPPQQSRGR